MYKYMIFISTMFQLFISTSIELIGNERGNLIDEPVPPVEPIVEPVVEPVVEPKAPTKNELLREMSKEYGLDMFDVKGIQKLKEIQDSQKTDLEKATELIESYKTKEVEWSNKENEFQSKLKASELGIPQDKLEDALKLAGGDPTKLDEVIKKYPTFVSKEGIKIGVTEPNNFQDPKGMSDMEKYMADNPQIYKKK